ncbi:MAG: four helix bundle protein [Anaerolineales bacterium]|nr:MAG: four helix bundle protein [Anaerolineales bacterium]
MMRDFRKIVAWQKADDLVVLVYEATGKSFPKDEIYGLTSQMRRAAVSAAANIAEGSGRQYLTEFRQFLYTARASLSEVEYYIHLAGRLGHMAGEEKAHLEQAETEAARTLQGFINSIERQIASGRKEN